MYPPVKPTNPIIGYVLLSIVWLLVTIIVAIIAYYMGEAHATTCLETLGLGC